MVSLESYPFPNELWDQQHFWGPLLCTSYPVFPFFRLYKLDEQQLLSQKSCAMQSMYFFSFHISEFIYWPTQWINISRFAITLLICVCFWLGCSCKVIKNKTSCYTYICPLQALVRYLAFSISLINMPWILVTDWMARYINVTKSMEVRIQCVITERMFEFREVCFRCATN